MKKVLGIAVALALLLSMTVMAIPAGAEITVVKVELSNPIANQFCNYTITFQMEEPLDVGESIDVTFPAGTDTWWWSSVVVTGTDQWGFSVTYTDLAELAPTCIPAAPVSPTLEITLTGMGILPGDLAPGTVTVYIENVYNADPCYQTLCVGTSRETCKQSPEYAIYLFRIDLLPGWNLISLPGIPDDTDIEVVLKDLMVTCAEHDFQVWWWDCGQWYVYCYDTAYETLTTMDECRAYWIYIERPASFYVKGIWYNLPPDPPYNKKCYHECWNMVGFTSQWNRSPSNYFQYLTPPGSISLVIGWDAMNQVWAPIDYVFGTMRVGQGYWVAFTQDACFVPPI